MTIKLLYLLRFTAVALSNFLPWPLFITLRARLYRFAGARVGSNAHIYGRQSVGEPRNLIIGDDVFINTECIFEASALITIGRGTLLGPGVKIFTTDHAKDLTKVARPVTVGADSWIGGASCLLPGCFLEAGSTVAAGTILLGRRYKAGVYAGVPARLVRSADR